MAARRSANSPNHATGSPPVSNPAGSRNGRQQSALRTRVLAQASATARPHRAQRVQDYTAVRPPFPVRGPQHSHQSLVGVAAPSPTSAVDGAMPISLCCVTKLYGSFVRPAQQTHSGPRTCKINSQRKCPQGRGDGRARAWCYWRPPRRPRRFPTWQARGRWRCGVSVPAACVGAQCARCRGQRLRSRCKCKARRRSRTLRR